MAIVGIIIALVYYVIMLIIHSLCLNIIFFPYVVNSLFIGLTVILVSSGIESSISILGWILCWVLLTIGVNILYYFSKEFLMSSLAYIIMVSSGTLWVVYFILGVIRRNYDIKTMIPHLIIAFIISILLTIFRGRKQIVFSVGSTICIITSWTIVITLNFLFFSSFLTEHIAYFYETYRTNHIGYFINTAIIGVIIGVIIGSLCSLVNYLISKRIYKKRLIF